jgi:hypothetical protein
MSDTPPAVKALAPARNVFFLAALTLAVLLSIACCAFILLIPTASINVNTVYEGF